MTEQAEQIKNALIANPELNAASLLSSGHGSSEIEIDFIIEQLKAKGEL